MTIPERAYLAALIDGEGTVHISDRRETRPNSSHPSIYLSVAGAYGPMHEWLIATAGTGSLTKYRISPTDEIRSRKQVYAWRVQSGRAVEILRQCEPYMLEKRERALQAIRCFEQGYSAFDGAGGV